MQFQVPQFIEVEDKIFGPLTFRQFVYVGGGLGGAYILWRILPLFIGAPLALIVVGLAMALAFFQLNGRPFIIALENAFFFAIRSKLYLWNNARKQAKKTVTPLEAAKKAEVYVPKLSDSRLHELAWSLDIKERIAAGTANDTERHIVRTPSELVSIHTSREALVQ
jgi:hypothetical protein